MPHPPDAPTPAELLARAAALRAEMRRVEREHEAHQRRPWLVRLLIPGRYIDRRFARIRREIDRIERLARG